MAHHVVIRNGDERTIMLVESNIFIIKSWQEHTIDSWDAMNYSDDYQEITMVMTSPSMAMKTHVSNPTGIVVMFLASLMHVVRMLTTLSRAKFHDIWLELSIITIILCKYNSL